MVLLVVGLNSVKYVVDSAKTMRGLILVAVCMI